MAVKTPSLPSLAVVNDAKVVDFLRAEHAVKSWIEQSLKIKLGEDLPSALKNGIILCYLMEEIEPQSIPRIQEKTDQVFKLKENISFFLGALSDYGVPRHKWFQVNDLFEAENIAKVIDCLSNLATIATEKGFHTKYKVDNQLKVTLPTGAALVLLKKSLATIKDTSSGPQRSRVGAVVLRTKLALLSGGTDLSKFEKGFSKFQALYRGYKARLAYKNRVRDIAFRERVAKEILSTEESYVKSLGLCINFYLLPMQDGNNLTKGKPLLTKDQVRSIFSDIQIIHSFNENLLKDLQNRISGTNWFINQKLGDRFLQVVGFLKVYANFVLNFNNSMAMLEEIKKKEKVLNFLNAVKVLPEVSGLDLPSFLIMPVQRVPRYNLLLEQLLKRTWHDHPDYKDLDDALKKVREVAVHLNEKKRDAEAIAKVYEVHSYLTGKFDPLFAPNRKVLREGAFNDIKSNETLYVYLFNDILVFGKTSEKLKGPITSTNSTPTRLKAKYKATLPLKEINVVEEGDCITVMKHTGRESTKELVLQPLNPDEKPEWLADMNKIISELNKKAEGSQTQATKKVEEESAEQILLTRKKQMQTMRVGKEGSPSTSNQSSPSGSTSSTPTVSSPLSISASASLTTSPTKAATTDRLSSSYPTASSPPIINSNNNNNNNNNNSNSNDTYPTPTNAEECAKTLKKLEESKSAIILQLKDIEAKISVKPSKGSDHSNLVRLRDEMQVELSDVTKKIDEFSALKFNEPPSEKPAYGVTLKSAPSSRFKEIPKQKEEIPESLLMLQKIKEKRASQNVAPANPSKTTPPTSTPATNSPQVSTPASTTPTTTTPSTSSPNGSATNSPSTASPATEDKEEKKRSKSFLSFLKK
eukprot:TRINITY_DN688_c0_g1_i1.p1 TRINITY_DN688_c0_g1~~TRINITY_DN688_c0_g1_i1.p1  ORF type:complete len:868 (+),score=238.12 TRINITY_DN688_c0_g1_i1:281-2884(+)